MDQALMKCVVEEEILVSPFSVTDMWQRLPSLLVEETFGYSTLQTARRLCGVGITWNSLLSHLAAINKGILFFRHCERGSCDADELCMYWDGLSLFGQGTVKHIVLQEVLPSLHTFVHSDQDVDVMDYGGILQLLVCLCRAISDAHQPVDTVTFYKGVCHPVLHSIPLSQREVSCLFASLTTLRSVRFLRCTVKAEITSIPRAAGKANGDFGWTWSYWMELPVEVLTREEVEHLQNDFSKELRRRTKYLDGPGLPGAANKYRSKYKAIERQMGRRWLLEWLLGSKALVSALLWPYPIGQLQWLKSSLATLDAPTRKRLSDAYSSYRNDRLYHMIQPGKHGDPEMDLSGNWHVVKCSGYKEEWQVEVGVRWGTSERKLDVMDCAFVAQFLSTMPNVPKPPYNVPFDFKARKDWRKAPTPKETLAEIDRDMALFKRRTSSLPFSTTKDT